MSKVMLLFSNPFLGKDLKARLEHRGAQSVYIVSEFWKFRFGTSKLFDMVFVDTLFSRTELETAALVFRVRKSYPGPIIGVQAYHKEDDLLALQVAGCNFFLRWPDSEMLGKPVETNMIGEGVCDLYQKIDLSLKQLREQDIG